MRHQKERIFNLPPVILWIVVLLVAIEGFSQLIAPETYLEILPALSPSCRGGLLSHSIRTACPPPSMRSRSDAEFRRAGGGAFSWRGSRNGGRR